MPRRTRLGQHFLASSTAAARIVALARLEPGDPAVEIGPGRGALTANLIEAAGQLTAIEIDTQLADRLAARFPGERLRLIRDDVLRVDWSLLRAGADRDLVVVGNLPYHVSKPVALSLVLHRRAIDRAVLMFQREVADRLTATPGNRSYGPLGILAGEAFEIQRAFHLSPKAFRPPPRVDSTVTVWTRRTESTLDRLEQPLRKCLRVAFSRRRQTLRNNLRAALEVPARVDALLERAALDGSARAEQLAPADFLRLAAAWSRAAV